MGKDLSLLGHKLKLLREIELNLVLDFETDAPCNRDVTAIQDANCKANIKSLAASKGTRHYHCTLVLRNDDNIMGGPSDIEWWNSLEEFDVFDRWIFRIRIGGWRKRMGRAAT